MSLFEVMKFQKMKLVHLPEKGVVMGSLASRSESIDTNPNHMDDKEQKDEKEPKDDPRREDIRLLGRVLGDTLREQEGEPTFDLVENIRQTAIRFRRDQDPKARQELDGLLNQLSNKATEAVVRAFSQFSQLSNIAEDMHHNRRRRSHLLARSQPQAGSVARALDLVFSSGTSSPALGRFFAAPDQLSDPEVQQLLVQFLVHVPNHLAAASKLATGIPVSDVFGVGATTETLD